LILFKLWSSFGFLHCVVSFGWADISQECTAGPHLQADGHNHSVHTQTVSCTLNATVKHLFEMQEQTQLPAHCQNTTDDRHNVLSLNMPVTNKKHCVFIGKCYGKGHFGGLGCWWQRAQLEHVLSSTCSCFILELLLMLSLYCSQASILQCAVCTHWAILAPSTFILGSIDSRTKWKTSKFLPSNLVQAGSLSNVAHTYHALGLQLYTAGFQFFQYFVIWLTFNKSHIHRW
jgi:hypothetical protein